MPAYKTIVHELLKDRPALHERLRAEGTLLPTMEQLAMAFRSCHLNWIKELEKTRPGGNPSQLSSEALELALEELQDLLPSESPTNDETLSLDQAMAFLQRHMPAE